MTAWFGDTGQLEVRYGVAGLFFGGLSIASLAPHNEILGLSVGLPFILVGLYILSGGAQR